MLRNFTPSNKNKQKIARAKSLNYDDTLAQIIQEEADSAPIVYDLDSEYLDYIAVLVQKIKIGMIHDIRELAEVYDCPDDMMEDILMTEANFGEED